MYTYNIDYNYSIDVPLPSWSVPVFRRRLAAYDARRHLPGIRSLMAQKYPGFPVQSACVSNYYATYPPRIIVTLMNEVEITDKMVYSQLSDPFIRDLAFDDIRLHDGASGVLATMGYGIGDDRPETSFQRFYWSMPYFCTQFGTQCWGSSNRISCVTLYKDENDRMLETAWSVVDELAYRGGLSPEMIFEGRIGEIRGKVLEIITHERTRMRMVDTKTS